MMIFELDFSDFLFSREAATFWFHFLYVFYFLFAHKQFFEHNTNLLLAILSHKGFVPTGEDWFQFIYLCPHSSHWTGGI